MWDRLRTCLRLAHGCLWDRFPTCLPVLCRRSIGCGLRLRARRRVSSLRCGGPAIRSFPMLRGAALSRFAARGRVGLIRRRRGGSMFALRRRLGRRCSSRSRRCVFSRSFASSDGLRRLRRCTRRLGPFGRLFGRWLIVDNRINQRGEAALARRRAFRGPGRPCGGSAGGLAWRPAGFFRFGVIVRLCQDQKSPQLGRTLGSQSRRVNSGQCLRASEMCSKVTAVVLCL